MRPRTLGFVFVLLAALLGPACGYRVGGQASRLPAHITVVAVPAFTNNTSWMRLEQRLTAAVMQELIHRTRYQVVGKPEGADAVLTGTVLGVNTAAVLVDPSTGSATAVQVTVRVAVELRDLKEQQVLYTNPAYVFREEYEITGDLDSFFEERQPALDRLARDFATTLVSAILENF